MYFSLILPRRKYNKKTCTLTTVKDTNDILTDHCHQRPVWFCLRTILSFLGPNGNFLFSLKESSSSKFNEASGYGDASAVLTESGMTFGTDELAITWSGEPAVINTAGNVFGITDVNSMAGEEQFTADDFEVLQPKGIVNDLQGP